MLLLILSTINLFCFLIDPAGNWLNGVIAIILAASAILEIIAEFTSLGE